MTKEQEEAIEILSDSNILFNIQKDTALSIRVAIETALDMINDLQRENKSLIQTNRSYKGMIRKKDKEIEKKNKIINEMIEEYEYNDRINFKNFCDEEIRKDKCIENCTICTIQYFERKANNEKNWNRRICKN